MGRIKFIFTGAHGTGKTTILNHFDEQKFPVITEVVRKLSKEGVNINEMGDEEGQKKIFDTYLTILTSDQDYISDRGLTDVISYSYDLSESGRVSQEEVFRELCELVKFNAEQTDVVYFYFPIEFDVVDDGVRSTDEEFRHRIDKNIRDLLITTKVPYITVTGTVEERIRIVEDAIKLQMANVFKNRQG